MIFKAKSYLLKHIGSHHSSIAYLPCSYCDSTFPTKQILGLHCKDEHPSESRSSQEEALVDEEQMCEFCHESFPSKIKHDYHIAKLHKDKLLTCKTCGYKALKYYYFLRHKRSTHPEEGIEKKEEESESESLIFKKEEKPRSSPHATAKSTPQIKDHRTHPKKPVKIIYLLRCELCVAGFLDKKRLDDHMSLHNAKTGFPCQQCGWLCHSKRTLENHLCKRHNKEKAPQPSWRPKRKNPESKFENIADEAIPYYCDHCHMIFRAKKFLLKHIDNYHFTMAYLPCSYCDASFPTKQILEFHCKDEHPSESECRSSPQEAPADEGQMCEYCSESFLSKIKHDYHIAKFHKDKLLTCKTCGYKAEKYYNLVRHKRNKHWKEEGKEKERYFCAHCTSNFGDPKYLNYHMKKVHYTELGIEEPLMCEECNVTFHAPSSLQKHMDNVHKKIKTHCCEYCGKAFSRIGDMKQHILLHTAPREEQYKKGPFFCQFCQAKFNVRQALYYHLKKLHTDKYAFKCEYCGTGYMTQNTLSRHLLQCK